MVERIDPDLYFSMVFSVNSETIFKYGAFDISLVSDLPLFIDPFLLFNSKKRAYKSLHNEIIKYLKFLKQKSATHNLEAGLIKEWYYFPEISQTWLGYSQIGNKGRGLGQSFADALHTGLRTVFSNFGEEQITEGSHLEKVCLIKPNVGRDNISDFTTNLINNYLLDYTQKFAIRYVDPSKRKIFSVRKVKFNYSTESWETAKFDLPVWHDNYVLLTPMDMLSYGETFINNRDFRQRAVFTQIVKALPNDSLRNNLNNYLEKILETESKFDKAEKERRWQEAVNHVIQKAPEIVDYYIKHKEENSEQATIDSTLNVSKIRQQFVINVQDIIHNIISDLIVKRAKYFSSFDEAIARVEYLKDVIEHKGGHKLFRYFQNVKESDIHILFRLVWFVTDAVVSAEVNDGRGPVDFKISYTPQDITLVEFKLASNTKLKKNLENQTEIYSRASDATHKIIVIVYFSAKEHEKVQRMLASIDNGTSKFIILIDGRSDNKPSGSNA